jgi:hypothetical protein
VPVTLPVAASKAPSPRRPGGPGRILALTATAKCHSGRAAVARGPRRAPSQPRPGPLPDRGAPAADSESAEGSGFLGRSTALERH